MIKYVRVILTCFAISLIISISGCAADEPAAVFEEEESTSITVLLDWTPNTNYSGLYAALEEGFYREEGLDVEIIQAPGSVVQMVAAGQAHFGVSYQEEVTYARVSHIPVVSIAAVIQNNTSGFASLKDKDIETPADFEGKSYGGWGSPVEEATIKALMDRYGADFSRVEIITTGEVDLLIVMEREADFAWIYYGWNGVEAELKGMELNFIPLRDVDPVLDYYTPVLITSESLIAEDPELVERFMTATTRGYKLSIEQPEKAAQILLKHAPELNEELVETSQLWLADKFQADAEVWGYQELETWELYAEWLYDNGLIEEIPEMGQAFTNRFLR